MAQLSHPYMTTEKTIALTTWTFVSKVMSLVFNRRTRFVIVFLPRSKHLLISWMQSPSSVILEPKETVTVPIVSPSICHEVMRPDAMIFVFWVLSFKPTFSLSSFTFIKRLISSFSLRWGYVAIFKFLLYQRQDRENNISPCYFKNHLILHLIYSVCVQ